MPGLPSREIHRPAEVRKRAGRPSPSRLNDVIHQCYMRMEEANKHFFPDQKERIMDYSRPIAQEVYEKLKKTQASNFEIVEVEDILDMSAQTIISFAKYEGFEEADINRILNGVVAGRLMNFDYIKNTGKSLTDDPNYSTYERTKKVELIVKEINQHGFIAVDNFYMKYPSFYDLITEAKTLADLHTIGLKAENDLRYTKEDHLILKKIRQNIRERSAILKKEAKSEVAMTKEQKAETYRQAFESALNYLRYVCPEEDIGKLVGFAEATVRMISKTRDALEFTRIFGSSHQLAELFWPIRLGRKIRGAEKLGLTKAMVEKYAKNIADRRLRTEAAGYWFERKTREMPRFEITPELTLIETIKSTLEAHELHFEHNQEPVNLMILVNDNTTLKFKLPPRATIQDIVQAIRVAEKKEHNLNLKDRYELKRESYKVGKKSKAYQEFYGQEENYEINLFGQRLLIPGITHPVEGDYIIRITTEGKRATQDKNSPFNLFAVNAHKALVDIDLNTQGLDFSVKFAHHYSDAKSTKPFFRHIYNRLKKVHDHYEELTLPQMPFLRAIPEIKQDKDVLVALPIFEATTAQTYDDTYEKFVFDPGGGNKLSVSPNIIRTAVLDLANDVNDSHVLLAAKVNPQTAGPYNNIQPVILSLHPIKSIYEEYKKDPTRLFAEKELQQVIIWIEKTNQAIDYAKKGLSTAAVLAAPLGRLENPITKITKVLHKGTNLLKSASGMFSPLPDLVPQEQLDDTAFYTATGDVYEKRADLNKPDSSIGTIGYNHTYIDDGSQRKNQIHYAIRKTPYQAQLGFKKFIETELLRGVIPHKDKKRVNTNKIITRLIVQWENLIIGKVSLESYILFLEDTYEKLGKNNACGFKAMYDVGINSAADLQRQLNLVLRRDAAETIDRNRLDTEKKRFYGFLDRINQQLKSGPDTSSSRTRSLPAQPNFNIV